MIDGNYHIEDVDELGSSSSIGNITKDDKTVVKTKVIYENSNTSKDSDSEKESEYQSFFYDEGGNQEDRENKRENRYSNEFHEKYNKDKRNFVEEWIIDLYERRPNTLKATLVGIVLALLILLIGFSKTLLIFVVVLIANLIGQLLDSNPRLLYLINLIRQRFR